MRKNVLWMCLLTALVFAGMRCGESYCKQYTQKFCSDANSPACKTAQEKVKNWSSSECRIQFNNLMIEEQAKDTEKLLEE